MAKHYGKCALCGRECELTFEHIPPRGAFNSTPARPVLGTEIFKEEIEDSIDICTAKTIRVARNFFKQE